ncbi:TetR/AcrR family transcriptional regulator [Pseudomonas aeruginosa]|uniref:TetR/AcrR family transcriptional regulator n=1 Tax=Pseudomonas aeruginosa TaxID=287 RepID=UPI001F208BF6|nr:TetR/AcrR family transcriptional regulator [Pseudomonas aeruginosa]MDG4275154.1 TetR/AcrR family transcriptional regulator [Pseudomonas aeruginosa]HBO3911205.1 TetR/AcrR family transcriptional regulator [Pseudomonas aeruginosa]HCF5874567.1 TetR/AcrR family transcriptional regulator [Pseudomonas aeruginosa]
MPDSRTRPAPRTRRRTNENESEPVTRRGRPVGDHNAKRAELLAAAISVIAREGYAGASMRRVAQHAGCTTGAVTYYFANKEEMVTAVAQNLFDKIDALLEINREQVDVKALIGQWLQSTSFDEPDGWLAWLQLLTHARHEPAFAVVIRQRYARFLQVFTSVLEEGQRQGKIRNDIPADLLADQISAISDGWMMMLPIEPERFGDGRGQALLDALITLISPPTQAAAKRPSKAKAK